MRLLLALLLFPALLCAEGTQAWYPHPHVDRQPARAL